MNYIKHLTGFFDKVAKDKTLNPTHISLYIALFQFWNCNRFKNPISISRDEIMRISKISSKATYHKCLKALHSLGYIKYEPSYNPFKGSHVFLFNFSDDLKPLSKSDRNSSPKFDPVAEQVQDKLQAGTQTGNGQSGEQALVPSINNTNNSNSTNFENIVNGQAPEDEIDNENSDPKKGSLVKKEKGCAEKEKEEMPALTTQSYEKDSSTAFADYTAEQTESSRQKSSVKKEEKTLGIKPTISEVQTYFQQQEFPELEANKFFNYFESIGWLVGGKTAMADWPAAARNWMLNAPKFIAHERTDRSKQLDTSAGKDYSEPL